MLPAPYSKSGTKIGFLKKGAAHILATPLYDIYQNRIFSKQCIEPGLATPFSEIHQNRDIEKGCRGSDAPTLVLEKRYQNKIF